jgi:hypothetical protein
MIKQISILFILFLLVSCSPANSNETSNLVYNSAASDSISSTNDVTSNNQVDGLEKNYTQLELDVINELMKNPNIKSIDDIEIVQIFPNDSFLIKFYDDFESKIPDSIDLDKLIADIAIGAAIITVYVVLSYTTGGTGGAFFSAALSQLSINSIILSAAIDAVISGYIAYKENADYEYVMGKAIMGIAEGFKFGSIIAPVVGSLVFIKAIKTAKNLSKLQAFRNSATTLDDLLKVTKNLDVILASTTKIGKEVTEDGLEKAFAELAKKSGEVVDFETFTKIVGNEKNIVNIVAVKDPFNNTARSIRYLQEQFVSKLGVGGDLLKQYLETILSKASNAYSQLPDVIKNFLKNENYYDEFIELFGPYLSKNFLNGLVLDRFGKQTFDVIEAIAKEKSNVYLKLLSNNSKELLDAFFANKSIRKTLNYILDDSVIKQIYNTELIYNLIARNTDVSLTTLSAFIKELSEGGIRSLDDLSRFGDSSKIIRESINNRGTIFVELLEKVKVNNVSDSFVDEVLREQFISKLNKFNLETSVFNNILDGKQSIDYLKNINQAAYEELVKNNHIYQQIIGRMKSKSPSLSRDLMSARLRQIGLENDTIEALLSGVSVNKLNLSDKVVMELKNELLSYFQTVNKDLYMQTVDDLIEVSTKVVNEYNITNGKRPLNYHLKGANYKFDDEYLKRVYGEITFNEFGYPIFDEFAYARIDLPGLLTGNNSVDAALANNMMFGDPAGLKGLTWHHVEDGRTMILVPTELNAVVKHTGGASYLDLGIYNGG